jgi:hypothetical protein
LSLDGCIAAPRDDLGWSVPSVPSDELFQWRFDRRTGRRGGVRHAPILKMHRDKPLQAA